MYGRNTSKSKLYMRQRITPFRFEITPVYVEIHWELLDGSESAKLLQSTPYLKYITIQLRLKQKNKLLQSKLMLKCRNLWGRGYGIPSDSVSFDALLLTPFCPISSVSDMEIVCA